MYTCWRRQGMSTSVVDEVFDHVNVYIYTHSYIYTYWRRQGISTTYMNVTTISRLLRMIGLFCKRAL